MKITSRIFIVLCLISVLFACKKQRTCSCTTESSTGTTSFDTLLPSMTKKDAKDECFKFNDGGDDGGGGIYKTTCELVK